MPLSDINLTLYGLTQSMQVYFIFFTALQYKKCYVVVIEPNTAVDLSRNIAMFTYNIL